MVFRFWTVFLPVQVRPTRFPFQGLLLILKVGPLGAELSLLFGYPSTPPRGRGDKVPPQLEAGWCSPLWSLGFCWITIHQELHLVFPLGPHSSLLHSLGYSYFISAGFFLVNDLLYLFFQPYRARHSLP